MNVSYLVQVNSSELFNSSLNTNDTLNLYPNSYLRKFTYTRVFLYIFSIAIIVLNSIVVISSGLIARKGQKLKSSYLFLGNVSLADTLIGILMLSSLGFDRKALTPFSCVVYSGLIIVPALVSIYSVFLIAVDRYIYIVHGLRYHRWINTNRVRLAIVGTWIFGTLVAFSPAIIIALQKHIHPKASCWDLMLLAPHHLITTSLMSLVPISLVLIIYVNILYEALKKVDELKHVAAQKEKNQGSTNNIQTITLTPAPEPADTNVHCSRSSIDTTTTEVENISDDTSSSAEADLPKDGTGNEDVIVSSSPNGVAPKIQDVRPSEESPNGRSLNNNPAHNVERCVSREDQPKGKRTEPNKWRAIKIVTFTVGGLMITWVPFFITKIIYGVCIIREGDCEELQYILINTLTIVGKTNSIFNPLFYAWWHPGFKKAFLKLVCQLKKGYINSCDGSSNC